MTALFQLDKHPVVFLRPRLSHPYGWIGHIPFAYLLVDLLQPASLVELGTHSGNSYLAFCQAIVELGLDTRCTAIDSWEGDAHARSYDSAVLADLKSFHDPRYAAFSRLSKKFFDDAVGDFEDSSIDLLHIDGLHTYEAVRHDFETWLPKLSERAVVILHDTEVRERDFGVWKFVEELEAKYRVFCFTHSNGLAVVEVGQRPTERFKAFMDHASENSDDVRAVFQRLAGTLIDADGRPTGASSALQPKPVNCRIYVRSEEGQYSEEASVQQTVATPERLCKLEFALPAAIAPDYIRIDFSETPGVFGIVSIDLGDEGAVPVPITGLGARVRHIGGDLLGPREPDWIRIVSFDEDPHVELDVRDIVASLPVGGEIVLTLVLDYELLVTDPTMWRMVSEAGTAIVSVRERRQRLPELDSAVREFSTRLHGFDDRVALMNDGVVALTTQNLYFHEVLAGVTGQLHHLSLEVARTGAASAAAIDHVTAQTGLQAAQIETLQAMLTRQAETIDILNRSRPIQRLKRLLGMQR